MLTKYMWHEAENDKDGDCISLPIEFESPAEGSAVPYLELVEEGRIRLMRRKLLNGLKNILELYRGGIVRIYKT